MSRGRRQIETFGWVAVVALSVATVNCEPSASPSDADSKKSSREQPSAELEVRPFDSPPVVDLVDPSEAFRREAEFGEPIRYPACRDLFESAGEMRETFLPGEERKEWAVYGCDPEAYRRTSEGRRYIAYRLAPGPDGGRDLRFAAFDREGALRWSHRVDRSGYTDHFTANFRSSFIAPLPPHLVCVGTLWSGGTTASCLELETGEPKWEGELKFWSGIPLQGHDVALHGADISGLTRRYPYSGVEMERTDFRRIGGHSGLYATDGEHLFFVPKKGGPNRLTSYAFDSMAPVWRTELPGRPEPAYDDAVFPSHGVVVLKVGPRLHAFDTGTGEARWSSKVGDDRPPMVAGPSRLYLLVDRDNRATLLFAIAPKSGKIDWYATVPTGTLNLAWLDDTLVIRSVRAFQTVRIPE